MKQELPLLPYYRLGNRQELLSNLPKVILLANTRTWAAWLATESTFHQHILLPMGYHWLGLAFSSNKVHGE